MSFTFPLSIPLAPLPNPIAPIPLLSPPLLRTFQSSPDPSPIPLIHSLSSLSRRRSPIAMSSSDARSSSACQITELITEADFEKLRFPDCRISNGGFGSLLSERSARSTLPELINFTVTRLNGFRRVFVYVAPIFFERGIAKPETKIPAYLERELEFQFLAVQPEKLDGKPFDNPALC